MKILGVSSYHHDSAAASINNGHIEGASHEERFTRKKYDNSFPTNTIEWLKNPHEDWEFAAFMKRPLTTGSNLISVNILELGLYL